MNTVFSGIQIFSLITAALNLGMLGFNYINIQKIKERAKRNLKDSQEFFNQAQAQADEINRIYQKEANYCKICKTIIKLRK